MTRGFIRRALKAVIAAGPECGAVLCLILLVWWGIWATLDNQRTSALDGAVRDTANLALAFDENTSRIIASADQVLLSLRSDYATDPSHFDLTAWAKREMPPDWVSAQIAVIQADGMSLASTASPERVYVGDREHFTVQRDSAADELFISKPVLGRSSGRWSVQLTRKVLLPNGTFGGIVVFSIDCYRLSEFYRSLNLQQGYIAVIGLDGIVRARGPVEDGRIGAHVEPGLSARLQDTSGSFHPVSRTGEAITLSYRRLKSYPLVVSVGFADKQVLAAYHRTRLNMTVSGTAATIVLLMVGTVWVVQRKRALRSQQALAVTLEHMNQGLVMVDEQQRVRVVNKRALQLLALPATMLGSLLSLRSALRRDATKTVLDALDQRPQPSGPPTSVDLPTDHLIVECNQSMIPGGGAIHVLTDVTARHMADQRIRYTALHDHLTGLGNRLLFADEADRRFASSESTGAPFAMLCLDLNRFKNVNDTFGHDTGDELLNEVARRLRALVSEADVVARIGGDEFAILNTSPDQPAAAEALAARIIEQFNEPFTLTGQALRVGSCVGVAIYPQHGRTRNELAKAADLALYAAKQDRTRPVRVFESAMAEAMEDKLRLEGDLRAALATEGIYAEYQPVFATSSLSVVGFEALARWNHPVRGRIRPDIFIPLAEETGLIIPLGRKILEHACRTALAWPEDIRIAVNLSPVQFRDPSLIATVSELLTSTGLPPKRLELEITEGVLINDEQEALETLSALRALGVSFALDDFGTGYSSLSYLRKFPFERVKVDRSFVQAQVQEKRARFILESLLGLGRNLGLGIVAEGVETRTQLHLLRQQGCDDVQGFLVGRPMPAAETMRLVPKRPADGARSPPLNTFALTEP